MADGGATFAVKLIDDVTRPSKAITSSMKAIKDQFKDTQKALAAPSPKRGAMSDWDKMVAKANRSQAADFAKEQAKLAKLKLAEQNKATKLAAAKEIKEAKRIADFKSGLAQTKLDNQSAAIGTLGDFAIGGVATVGAAALAAAAAVGYLAYQFGKASVQAAAFAEQSRLALTLLTGSAGTAAKQFDLVRYEAQELGLDVEDTVHGFQKLLAAQFSIGKAKELLRMSSDLQAIGASAEQTKRAIIAISQIKNTGYLQGDELNQLREAGVSTELVYEALGKRLGKTTKELIAMQEKRQLAAEPVIESILEAVRKKTGVEKAGDAGKKFAESTLIGMMAALKARGQNFFIDVGDAILPGVQKLFRLVTGELGKIVDNPKIKALGTFLLSEFEIFVLWVEAEWPSISQTLTSGAELMADSIRMVVELFDTGTVKGKVFAAALFVAASLLSILAVALGIVAVAGFVLMAPLYILVGVIGLVAYAVYKAISWIVDALKWLGGSTGSGAAVPTGSTLTTSAVVGAPIAAATNTITTAADVGPMARASGFMAAPPPEQVTVASVEQTPAGPSNHFDFSGMQVGANVDQSSLVAQIRSQVTKAIQEAAT